MKEFNYGGIKISIGISENKSEKENINLINEKNILEKWVLFLNDRYLTNEFTISENTADYTTLSFKDYDFLRLHYGEKSKWVKVLIASAYKKQFVDDIRFNQENKNQVYWKIPIDNDDINYIIDILDEEYDFITK